MSTTIDPAMTVAELDALIGRWRWPEHPQYTVMGASPQRHHLTVIDEVNGELTEVSRQVGRQGTTNRPTPFQAGYAYMLAHAPAPAWHSATEGEIWAIRLTPERKGYVTYTVRDGAFWPVFPGSNEIVSIPTNSPLITTAYRVWSERAE